jgi:chemotaxis protein histidine kinase CheA
MSFKSLIARLLKNARDQVFKLDGYVVKTGITFADNSIDILENKIVGLLGIPLPINFSIEDLLKSELGQTLSTRAQEKIAARQAEKNKEKQERQAERLALEIERSARHEQALIDIQTEYADRLKELAEQSNENLIFTNIAVSAPPTRTTEIVAGREIVVSEPGRRIIFSVLGDRVEEIQSGDLRSLRGANYDGATLSNDDLTIIADKIPLIGFEIFTKKVVQQTENLLTFEEQAAIKSQIESDYQAALDAEDIIWEQEKERYRQEDKDARDKEKSREQSDRYYQRLENKANREEAKDQRKEDRKNRKSTNKQERKDNKLERANQKQDKQDTRDDRNNRISEAKDARDEAEIAANQLREDAANDLQALVALGRLSQSQADEILAQFEDEADLNETNAQNNLQNVKQGIRAEKYEQKQLKRQERLQRIAERQENLPPFLRFDTSKLRDPAFIASVYQQTYQFIPQEDKDAIGKALAEYEITLNRTFTTITAIKSVIIAVRNILGTLGTTGQTLSIVGESINAAATIITTLPIPTGAPLGVGLPLNVITSLSETLDALNEQGKKIDGASELINDSVPTIDEKLDRTLDILEPIITVITILVDIIAFLTYIARSGKVSIDDILNDLNNSVNNALNITGDSSNISENIDSENNLLSQLDPNSNNPLFYRGFRLTLQYRKEENLLTQTRVLAVNETNGVSLATDFSFTSTPEVLVSEIKFQIDNYNLIYINDPTLPGPETFESLDVIDIPSGVGSIIPELDIDTEIEMEGLPERLTKKEIRQKKRKDKRKDKKERIDLRKSGDLTRREARQDRKQDRKERKEEAKQRRKNRKRKKEG